MAAKKSKPPEVVPVLGQYTFFDKILPENHRSKPPEAPIEVGPEPKKITLGDYLNSINKTKVDLMVETTDIKAAEQAYVPFTVNKSMSYYHDCVYYANEMNKFANSISKRMQYLFYLHLVPQKNRFQRWERKTKIENLDLVKTAYNYSNKKAEEALRILTEADIERLRADQFVGGVSKEQ